MRKTDKHDQDSHKDTNRHAKVSIYYCSYRVIHLKTIQNIIDSINHRHCNGFVNDSLKETLHLLKMRRIS